jgi:hypothetical protein
MSLIDGARATVANLPDLGMLIYSNHEKRQEEQQHASETHASCG